MNQHKLYTDDTIRIRLIDSTLFEIEETLDLAVRKPSLITKSSRRLMALERSNIFFDPEGEMMYVEQNGSLYEWKLRASEEGPEWWLGEE